MDAERKKRNSQRKVNYYYYYNAYLFMYPGVETPAGASIHLPGNVKRERDKQLIVNFLEGSKLYSFLMRSKSHKVRIYFLTNFE